MLAENRIEKKDELMQKPRGNPVISLIDGSSEHYVSYLVELQSERVVPAIVAQSLPEKFE